MDPISLAFMGVGLGMKIFGSISGSEDAQKASQVSQDEARQEQSINDAKTQAMEMNGRRQQLDIIRTQQRQRAQAVQTATTQGANQGSGLQGGIAQGFDQTLFNLQGVNNALATGRQINTLNQNISNDKQQMAGIQADQANDAAWSSVGGSLMTAGPTIGNLAKGFGGGGGFGMGSPFMGGFSPSGYGSGSSR